MNYIIVHGENHLPQKAATLYVKKIDSRMSHYNIYLRGTNAQTSVMIVT